MCKVPSLYGPQSALISPVWMFYDIIPGSADNNEKMLGKVVYNLF